MKIETTAEEMSKYVALYSTGLLLAFGIHLKPFEFIQLQESLFTDLTQNDTLKKSIEQFDELLGVMKK